MPVAEESVNNSLPSSNTTSPNNDASLNEIPAVEQQPQILSESISLSNSQNSNGNMNPNPTPNQTPNPNNKNANNQQNIENKAKSTQDRIRNSISDFFS